MALRAVVWMGESKANLVAFPTDARHDAGHQLEKVQRGLDPSDWKPIPTVGSGVREIRIHEESGAFRVIYLAIRPEAVYVLHCFRKKSQKTSRRDIQLAMKRFKAIPRA